MVAAAGRPYATGSTTLSNWSGEELPGQDDPGSSAALRQLRTRYDRLRSDYETLLDRLSDLEDRLVHAGQGAETPPRPGRLVEVVTQPLYDLRKEYVEAAASINSIVAGLEELTTRGMKAQHSATGSEAPASPGVGDLPEELEVAVEGGDFGDLLDFQQHLSGINRVSQVSIRSLDRDRATLVVRLHPRETES
ncbi:MAG: hypothetical protein KC491_13845 [Dehalococcoidia bacterium]|nr:hypothetical protein [Dehalococcoidia bacterium]